MITSSVVPGTLEAHQLFPLNQSVLTAPDHTETDELTVAGKNTTLRLALEEVCDNLNSTVVTEDNTPVHKTALALEAARVATWVPFISANTLSSLPITISEYVLQLKPVRLKLM